MKWSKTCFFQIQGMTVVAHKMALVRYNILCVPSSTVAPYNIIPTRGNDDLRNWSPVSFNASSELVLSTRWKIEGRPPILFFFSFYITIGLNSIWKNGKNRIIS
jgi:hypothetical protein